MAAPKYHPPEAQALSAAATSAGATLHVTSSSTPPIGTPELNASMLKPDMVLASRYQIIGLLGQGGMGAVYKAHDLELDRIVALKTIHPDYARNSAFLQRFKQEVLLASEITHPNVIRIFDIAEDGGMKFITMEFVEGEDLHSILARRGKLPPAEAIDVIRQVCAALDAAHKRGVIHRDLKPQNIMCDQRGRVVVMDFGLARGLDGDGLTQSGALIGTMAYMSPEQALGAELDSRSDIFAVGLILFELLSGTVPYSAESAIGSLLKRTQVAAVRVSAIDASIPMRVSEIVARCLERDKQLRYQRANDLLNDLESWQLKPLGHASGWRRVHLPGRTQLIVGSACLLISLAAAGVYARPQLIGWRTTTEQAQVHTPKMAIAILPLRNASGDASIDWLGGSVAEMLGTDVGRSGSLRNVSGDRLHQILQDLRITPASTLEPNSLRRLAGYSNADVIVSGQYVKFGDRIRLDLTLQDVKNDRSIPIKAEAASQDQLLAAVDSVAETIRSNLALPADAKEELREAAFKPTTTSIGALKHFTEGLTFLRKGKNLQARDAFRASAENDAKFALAYSKLGQALSNLGYGDEAERASRTAVELSRSLPEPEKYQILAQHARVTKNYPKAIEAYLTLARVLPDDIDVQTALAQLYEDTRQTDKAAEFYQKLIAQDPKNVDALIGMGRVGILRGDAQAGLEHLNVALTTAVQVDNEEQKASALYLLGTSYGMLNKPADALRSLQQALEIRQNQNDKGGTAQTLNAIAQVQQVSGKSAEAQKNYRQSLLLRQEIGDRRGTANTLLDLGSLLEAQGNYDQALEFTKQSLQIQRELQDPQNEATCLNNIGWIYLDKSDFENATTYFQQALSIREKLGDSAAIADTVYNLADAQSRMGQYDAAIEYYLRSVELWRKVNDKRGQALAAYGLGKLFAYQGRYGAAVNSERDALERMREVNDDGLWLAHVQGEFGHSLAMAGNDAEAQKNLAAALDVAGKVNNPSLTVKLLNYEGERLFYKGDYSAAQVQFGKAASNARLAKDPENVLLSNFNVAKTAVKRNVSKSTIRKLTDIAAQADRAGLKYLSLNALTYAAEGMINTRETDRAADLLNRTLRDSEKMNFKMLQARSRILLATISRTSGDEAANASRQLTEARQLLDEIRGEVQGSGFINRSDVSPAYAEPEKPVHGGAN